MKTVENFLLAAVLIPAAFGVMAAQDGAAEAAEKPLGVELLYRADVVSNLSGGIRKGTTVLSNLDLKLSADLEALGGWPATNLFMHGIASNGGKPNGRNVGSIQGWTTSRSRPTRRRSFRPGCRRTGSRTGSRCCSGCTT